MTFRDDFPRRSKDKVDAWAEEPDAIAPAFWGNALRSRRWSDCLRRGALLWWSFTFTFRRPAVFNYCSQLLGFGGVFLDQGVIEELFMVKASFSWMWCAGYPASLFAVDTRAHPIHRAKLDGLSLCFRKKRKPWWRRATFMNQKWQDYQQSQRVR